jgi:hypothetical protein
MCAAAAAAAGAPLSLLLLLQVFAPGSEPHLQLLADSAARSAEATAAGQELDPQDSQVLRVQRFVQVCGVSKSALGLGV